MESIAQQLEIRDRVMRRVYQAMTPHERIARWAVLHEAAMARLEASPEGYRRFIQRNMRQRAVAVSHELPATN